MTVHKLNLVWKRDGQDVELGVCFNGTRPVNGELISFSSEEARDQTGVWKVVLVYHQPFMERSQTWRDWRERGTQPEDMTTYWVEPAEGPWEP
jgi:hypothetical protein